MLGQRLCTSQHEPVVVKSHICKAVYTGAKDFRKVYVVAGGGYDQVATCSVFSSGMSYALSGCSVAGDPDR